MTSLVLSPVPALLSKHWTITVNRADTRLLDMYERHYSCHEYKDGRVRRQGVAPGEYIALMTTDLDALFVWQKSKYRQDGQEGVNCAVFRNEAPQGKYLASQLITEAVEIAWAKWGYQRLFTYVDPTRIQSSNPGYCFKMATPEWRDCGESASGLKILECRG